MTSLHEHLAPRVRAWRDVGYPCELYPAVAEVLEWGRDPESGHLRFLRAPQLNALEAYWYLRLVEGTPHVFDLYVRTFPKASELLEALGLGHEEITRIVIDEGPDALWDRIKTDDEFVRAHRLESLRETLTLAYPSYILALAMGAGKTILIGAIIATEFALAMEYPEGPFVQNALVFAPGKTIIESLRELVQVPYNHILPPRFHKRFAASVKLTFTRDGEKDLPVVRGSVFNVIVTNTEKIRIQKETVRKSDLGGLFAEGKVDEARAEVANLRLQAIASLPHLAVFSDEAHHTYGQSLDTELKKVRKTVDYLAAKTNLIVVVNTTGTPYFQRQPLRDVVIWYGLSQGIRDNILKDLSGNILAFEFEGDAAAYVEHVVEDFFKEYGDVRLPNGAPAKIAIYFPQTRDLQELRAAVDRALAKVGLSPAICLVNTSDDTLTKAADIDAFNRLNDPAAPHRVILLVNKGTEGWNCPSLFACALARRLRTSNNFVLQAATRCLRQVPGNTHKARVYLSRDNYSALDNQLQENFGESIDLLNRQARETRRARIVLRKLHIPPLVVTKLVSRVERKPASEKPLALERPAGSGARGLTRAVLTVGEQVSTPRILIQLGDSVMIETAPDGFDAYAAAVELAGRYRVDVWSVYDELRRLYAADDVPAAHLDALARQVERASGEYEKKEERVEFALALVKPEGFMKEEISGTEVYTAEIAYPKDREHLLLSWEAMRERNPRDFGFHYDPYDFDSNPEKSCFEQLLAELNLRSDDIEDVYFTGALTNPAQTDFFIEYKDDKGKWRRYTPDFVIRKTDGRVMIVEVKAARERDAIVQGVGKESKKALALKKWTDLDPDRLKYEILFTEADVVSADQLAPARRFLEAE
ncbi:MAG: DEAD/DEAH box helicase family protein [Gemmatimonadales bacterium]